MSVDSRNQYTLARRVIITGQLRTKRQISIMVKWTEGRRQKVCRRQNVEITMLKVKQTLPSGEGSRFFSWISVFLSCSESNFSTPSSRALWVFSCCTSGTGAAMSQSGRGTEHCGTLTVDWGCCDAGELAQRYTGISTTAAHSRRTHQ